MTSAKTPVFLFLTSAIVALWAVPAWANPIIPPFAVFWPAAWIALPAVVIVEAAVAVPVLKMRFLTALKISAAANMVSTLFGVPLATCLYPSSLIEEIQEKRFVATVALILPNYLLAVPCEALVARRLVAPALRRRVWLWAALANGLTYAMLGVLFVWATYH